MTFAAQPSRIKTPLLALLLTCLAIPLSGCGQKGDLYLPESASSETVVSERPSADTATDSQAKKRSEP